MKTYLYQAELNQIIRRHLWHQKRLQQYADRIGLSLGYVQIILQDRTRAPFFEAEMDALVDPEYKSFNKLE